MLKQKINSYIGMLAVLAVGIGASYVIITVANGTDSSTRALVEVSVVAD